MPNSVPITSIFLFTVGYKYNLTDNLAVDGRFGAFFGVDMAGKYDFGDDDGDVKIGDIEDYKRCDGGLIIGMGVWYKRINIDYTFKRGFGEVWEDGPAGAVKPHDSSGLRILI